MSRKKKPLQQATHVDNESSISVADEVSSTATQLEPTDDSGGVEEQQEMMYLNSLEARWKLEKWSIIRELHRAKVQSILFYMKPAGGNLDMQEAIKRAYHHPTEEEFDQELDHIAAWNIDHLSWDSLDRIFTRNPDYAQEIWEEIKDQADKDFRSGHFAAELFERSKHMKDLWSRARFIAVRDGFIDEYKPRGAIEISMIDMLAVNFFLWMHWVEEHLQRSITEPRVESHDYTKWKQMQEQFAKNNKKYGGQYDKGEWDIPYQSESEAIEHAAQLADRFRRAYQSQLRAIRDWRRYSVPVTINNPQQVNIAADGGQQINAIKVEDKS